MLENTEYDIGREYKIQQSHQARETREGQLAIRKKRPHKKLDIKTTLKVVMLEVYLAGIG